jgi:endonuclease YncB( thermonuclease family)
MKILPLFLILFAVPVWAAEFGARVVGVADGDTLTVLIECAKFEMPVRLSGIDAPEKKMPFGDKSKKSLSDLSFGKSVTVDFEKRDKYGRLVGKVIVDGQDASLTQIKRGMAWHFKEYEYDQTAEDRAAYAAAEVAARGDMVGLWRDTAPMAPWDWRKKSRAKGVKVDVPHAVESAVGP